MNPNQISPDDPRLTLYALGEMEPHEQAGFEKLLEQDPAAREVVADIRATAATVTAALEQEPAEMAAKPAGRILRFPQAYFMISGLAAACFAVFFVLWQNDQSLKKQTHLIELPLAQAKPAADGKGEGVVTADTPPPAAVPAPVPAVTLQLAESSPMPATLPLQDAYRGAANVVGADVGSMRIEADALNARESRLRSDVASSERKNDDERQVTAVTMQKAHAAAPVEPNAESFGKEPMPARAAPGEGIPDAFSISGLVSKPTSGERSRAAGGLARQQLAADTEAYGYHADNGYLRVADQPLSTFSIDVDTAAYANVRRFLSQQRLPPADAVRIEELVNYFPYDYAPPTGNEPFAASLEVAEAPWAPAHRLVRIGLKGREITAAHRPAANLVFLLDVSGSMNQPNRLPLVKQSLRLLVNKLRPDDRVAIAVYAGASGMALPSTSAREKAVILEAIDQLTPGGSTNGAMGIHLAYDLAKANFIEGGVNRVILATDGDFNVGTTSEGELVRLIEEKARSGVFLSVLGYGMGNLKDSML